MLTLNPEIDMQSDPKHTYLGISLAEFNETSLLVHLGLHLLTSLFCEEVN